MMTLVSQNLAAVFTLQNAVYDLQTFGVLETTRAGTPDLYDSAVSAHNRLSVLGDLVDAGDVRRIGQLLKTPFYPQAYPLLRNYLPYLSRVLETRRGLDERAVRFRLSQARRIVGGARRADAVLPVWSSPFPSAPAWSRNFIINRTEAEPAENVLKASLNPSGRALIGRAAVADVRIDERTVSRRHAEIQFHHGWFWIKDLGSSLGTVVQGLRLSPDHWYPLWAGAAVFVGETVRFQFVRRPELDVLAPEIASQPDLESLLNFLKSRGYGPLAQGIAEGSMDIPETGGLRIKVYELLVDRDYRAIREKYFPGVGEALSFDLMDRTAEAVASAATRDDLVSALRRSPVPHLGRWADQADKYLRGAIFSFLRGFPEEFGIRWKLEQLSRHR